MSSSGLTELRALLFAGEEIVRDDWRAMGDTAAPNAAISHGTRAGSALDRIAQIGALVVERKSADGLQLVLDTLVRLYRDADREGAAVGQRSVTDEVAARRRREIAVRAYVPGGLAVYQNSFEFVRPLVLQRPDEVRETRLWLRDTVTSLARSQQFERQTLIPIISEYIADRPVLFSRFRSTRDDTVNALCQFDFLQCLVSVAETKDVYACYPNFGAYHNERTEPVIARLIKGEAARQAVIPGIDDQRLAALIREIDRATGQLFFNVAGWDSGWWMIPDIEEFLSRHPS